jgi:acyl-CoA thioester hydrolase
MTYSDYKHIIPIQIRFCDIDKLNHVNNACYHNYFELGRVNYFNQLFQEKINWDKEGFVLARTEIDHLLPVFLEDEIYCCTKVIKLGNKSITLKNCILKKSATGFSECAAGIGILVASDYVNNVSIQLPEAWRQLIQTFES